MKAYLGTRIAKTHTSENSPLVPSFFTVEERHYALEVILM